MGAQGDGRVNEEKLRQGVNEKVAGNYAEAERLVREVLSDEPDSPQAHRELGLILNFTGEFEQSIDELKLAVQLDSAFLDARNDLALAYSMLGFMDEAKAELVAVLEMDPGNQTAQRHIVYFE